MSAGASAESATSAIAELVRARAGLVFPASRKGDVDNAIRKTMVKAGITNVVEWAGVLHGRTSLLDDLITELTIGETYFFWRAWSFRNDPVAKWWSRKDEPAEEVGLSDRQLGDQIVKQRCPAVQKPGPFHHVGDPRLHHGLANCVVDIAFAACGKHQAGAGTDQLGED